MLGTGSAIVFLSSLGARAVVSTLAAYASTKGAINTLVKYFAAALGQRGIRVNAVAPGVIDTDMSNFTKTEDGRAVIMGMQSLKRIGPPADVASVVAEKSHSPFRRAMLSGIEVKVINVVKLSAAQGGRYDLGIRTDVFLQFHVAVSLIAIASGLVVLFGLVAAKPLAGWTVLFLVTTILTGVTGFPLAPFGLDPPHVVGIILLVLMAAAVVGLYVFHLAGAWRWIYVVAAVIRFI